MFLLKRRGSHNNGETDDPSLQDGKVKTTFNFSFFFWLFFLLDHDILIVMGLTDRLGARFMDRVKFLNFFKWL